MGGVGTVAEEPGDLAGQVMGERIDRLENKVKEWLIILLIRPPCLSRAPARHTPIPTLISYSVILLQSAFGLTASGKC